MQKKITEKIINIATKYIQTLSDIEKKHIRDKINKINSKYNTLIKLKKQKYSYEEIDPLFFCFEDLPPTGKEYWFMKFVSTQQEDERQLLVMFGIGVEAMKINKKEEKGNKDEKGNKNGHMTAWCYDNKKHLVLDERCSISITPNNILISDKGNEINYKGNFPKYHLKLFKKNKEIANLKITKPENNSNSFEFGIYFKLFAGFALTNLYFDFSGTLKGKKFNGKCYVQKVVLIGPFVPWFWGRIVFSNGSILNYYEPRIELSRFNYKLNSLFEFYDNKADKKYIFNDLNVMKFGKKNLRWIITANKGKFFVCLKSYCSHTFEFEKIGHFTYVEYLTKVTDIFIEESNIDTSKLGSGFGLVEDARGYVL